MANLDSAFRNLTLTSLPRALPFNFAISIPQFEISLTIGHSEFRNSQSEITRSTPLYLRRLWCLWFCVFAIRISKSEITALPFALATVPFILRYASATAAYQHQWEKRLVNNALANTSSWMMTLLASIIATRLMGRTGKPISRSGDLRRADLPRSIR
jgi:hypothetical protein